jgi:HIV Tat-specific factor 1
LQEVREATLGSVGLRNGSHSNNEQRANYSTLGEDPFPPSFLLLLLEKTVLHFVLSAVSSNDDEDEFEKWQREVKEAEAEAERLKNGSLPGNTGDDFGIDDSDRILSPPDGEDEF